jgi:hypothetical protein
MERGANLTPQEIMAIGAQDAELGKLAAKVFLDGQKMTAQQQKAQALIAQGYDEKTANDLSLGVIKDGVDERGRPIRMNMATGEILPVGGGSPMQGNTQPTYQPFSDETMLGGDGAPAPNIDSNIGMSDIPSIDNVANEMGLDLTNPTDAKTAERIFKSRIAGNKSVADKQVNTDAITNSFNNFEQQYATQKQAIAKAKEKIAAGGSTGLINQLTGFIASSPAGSLNADLEVLQANAFLDALVQLKKASPTGSTGLGSVTETEGERIVKSKGNLQGKSKDEDLLRYLDNYEKTLDNAYVNITKGTQKLAPNVFEQRQSAPVNGGGIKFLGFE